MKMLLKRNLLESVTIISSSGTIVCVLLNYLTNISPITGILFHLYIVFLFSLSVSLSFKFIQWLLHLNKPLKYDLEGLAKACPYFSFLSGYISQVREYRIKNEIEELREYDTNELSIITTVLEKKLVSSWYVPYISQEIGFPFACKQMLDQMIGMTFQICNKIDSKEVFVDTSFIITTHLKEYRKALKRHEKSPGSSIESLYKKSHQISDISKKYSTADHCTNILRIILKELVPWELWDTPHSELLVRILSKKLDNFIDSTLANPDWLNDRLLTILNSKDEIITETAMNENEPDIRNKEELLQVSTEVTSKEEITTQIPKPETTTIECTLSTLITNSMAPILQRDIDEEIKADVQIPKDNAKDASVYSEPVEINSSPILREKRGRQGRNEVKIYDRIIEGSVKTWETDIDLQCISLGQDLLASLDGEITLSRLWGQDAEPDGSPNPPRENSPQPLWFESSAHSLSRMNIGEEDSLEMELADTSPHKESRSPVKKEFSPKPTDALLKDIQSTVHQAKSKIGDLQVHKLTNVDVNLKHNDEAAGMMEGLLDFGIAGLKKGLRFTGLSDDSQEKSPSHHKEREYKMSPPDMTKSKPAMEAREQITSTVIQKDDNGGSTVPPLVKQHRVTSQDSVPRPILKGEGAASTVPLSESPEPEYEEAADLSTSIAKLRSLLQQRAQTSPPRNEDMWWESAEETRGHTQRHHSSRPVDTATLADEYDMKCERNSSPEQTVNNRQRLDKLFHRTVTDVFNSIKTAVGVEGDDVAPHALHEWTYVCTSIEDSVGGMVARLVGSRRAYAHVDAALDSLQHLALPPKKRELAPEDFDEWCMYMCARWCCASEVACAAHLWSSHVAQRIATVLFADLAESLINMWLEDFTAWLKNQIFIIFKQMSEQSPETASGAKDKIKLRPFNVDETCAVVMKKMPELYVFGEETLTQAVRLSLSSFSHKEVNKDVVFRLLDILALHFKTSAGQRNPSFDVN